MTILSNEPPPSERQIGVLADYISMYTTDDTPEEYKYAGLYIAPKDYFKELVLLQYRLRGIAPKDALAVMQQERNTVILHIYNEYWQLDAGTPLAVPNNIIPTLAAQYGVYASHSIPSMMHDLGINELIVDNTLDTWHLPKDPGLTLVTTVANRFLVYAPSTPAK